MVLERCREKGIKLNPKKKQIGASEVRYMGHVLSADGLKIDPNTVTAIETISIPEDKSAVRRLLGMINYLAKFVPRLADHLAPLRRVTEKETDFQWGDAEQKALDKVKTMISTTPVLRYYDVTKKVLLSVDTSSKALRAVLLQSGQPVAYVSKASTATEQNWSQIEKELGAIVFGVQYFHRYIYGKQILVETDHKPLVSIVQKPLYRTPARLLNLRFKLMPYQITLKYTKGKELVIADTLSRATLNAEDEECLIHEMEVSQPILNATETQIDELVEHTMQDETLQKLKGVIRD